MTVDPAALGVRSRDTLRLTWEERRWTRKRVTTTGGREVALALPTGSVLEPGRYPMGAVYLELPHELVDVNVHPQKAEVRFADGRAVSDSLFKIVGAAVRAAFGLPDPVGYPGKKQKLFDEPTGPWRRMTRFSGPYPSHAALKTCTRRISGMSRPKTASEPTFCSSLKKL